MARVARLVLRTHRVRAQAGNKRRNGRGPSTWVSCQQLNRFWLSRNCAVVNCILALVVLSFMPAHDDTGSTRGALFCCSAQPFFHWLQVRREFGLLSPSVSEISLKFDRGIIFHVTAATAIDRQRATLSQIEIEHNAQE